MVGFTAMMNLMKDLTECVTPHEGPAIILPYFGRTTSS